MTNSSSNPLVSIIIPAYNAQEFLSETLESILKQSYENIEIILIDDGSTDETSQIVSRYKDRVKYFFRIIVVVVPYRVILVFKKSWRISLL